MTELVTEQPRTRGLRMLLELAVVVVFLLLIGNNYTLRRRPAAGVTPPSSRGFVPKDFVESIPTIALDGTRGSIDLRQSRAVVALVDPRCESCKEIIATLRPQPDLHVLSIAPMPETRTMATQSGLTAVTRILDEPRIPERNGAQFHIYPQVFVVDHGKVVRTCATIAECR